MWFRKRSPDDEAFLQQAQARSASFERALLSNTLPDVVENRLAKQAKGELPWTSGLSTSAFCLVRSYGLKPIGLVTGNCVYKASTMQNPSWTNMSYHVTYMEDALIDAMRIARCRLEDEAITLKAHAVVDVTIRIEWLGEPGHFAITLFGTAVTYGTESPPSRPLLCTVPADDLFKLWSDGVTPVGLVFGVGVYYQYSTRADRWSAGSFYNQEMTAYSQAVYHVRHRATSNLMQDARTYIAHGVLSQETSFNVQEVEVERGQGDERIDHILQFTILGTAVAGAVAKASTIRAGLLL